jgi:hypothetical protein
VRTFAFLAWIVGVPAVAFAQGAIAGSVRDSSGAALPGVLVEASSASLIERTRSTLSDSGGRYRIEGLLPGLYTVTFALKGWRSYQKAGIALEGSVTAAVDATLSIGSLTDTITVTGEVPAVDAHGVSREVTLPGDVIKSIPTVRSYNALVVLVPGVLTSANDTVTGTATTSFPIHGGRTNESRLAVDGFTIGSPPSSNSATSYVIDVGETHEVTFTSAGALGESETGGLVMNVVPKSGGNDLHASIYASGSSEAFQSTNLTPALRQQGVAPATPFTTMYDVSGSVGGPIVRNRLWYFVNAHSGGSSQSSTNVYYNLNAGDAAKWLYAPDLRRLEYSDRTFENAAARVTWQVNQRHKVAAFWDAQSLCRTCSGATPGLSEPQRVSPEAVGVLGRPLNVFQATWMSPATNRLLLEAGFGGTYFGVGNFEREPNPTRDLIRVAEQCANGCAANGNIPGLVYRSQDFSVAYTGSYLWKGSISYVTSTTTARVGYQHTLMTDDRTWYTNNQNLTYRLNNGVPNQLTESISPWVNNARAAWDGLFARGQWRFERLTLQAAVRFDHARSWFPEQQEGASRFLPTAIVIPKTKGVDSYKDVTPRFGAAYDVFGTGRTALKVNVGKYLEGVGVAGTYANTNPSLRLPQTTSVFGTAGVTRAWNDANQNFVPDCDLLNPAAQDLRIAGGDMCGVVSNTSFGKNVLTNNFDPSVLNGWGVRPSDWEVAVSFEQQIRSRSSVAVTYTRRTFEGFSVADNRALQPPDLTPFELVAPIDRRLPGGGGYTISGLYDVVPEKAGQVDNLITDAARYGAWSQSFNGVDVTVNTRLTRGFTLVGGTSTGQTMTDNCDVRAHLPELATTTTATSAFGAGLLNSAVTPVSPYCRVATGFLTQLRGLASYLIPKADVQLSATFQSKPGPMLAANYAAPNASVAPSLGRSLSGSAANVTVNLVAPGAMYGDRVNQLDLRIGKLFKVNGTRTSIALDMYNALNSSAVLAYNNAFVPGGTWLQPMMILTPRFLKLTAEFQF